MKDNKKLYVSIYFSEILDYKSIDKFGQRCVFLVEVTYDPDDNSHEYSDPTLMASVEGGPASWKSLPVFLRDDWQQVDRIELDDTKGLFCFLDHTLKSDFQTPKIAWSVADNASSYAHRASDNHTVQPADMIDHFGTLIYLDELDAEKLAEAYVHGSETRAEDLHEFLNDVFLTSLRMTIARAVSEFGS